MMAEPNTIERTRVVFDVDEDAELLSLWYIAHMLNNDMSIQLQMRACAYPGVGIKKGIKIREVAIVDVYGCKRLHRSEN